MGADRKPFPRARRAGAMVDDPVLQALQTQLATALANHPEREPPVPGRFELHLSGSEPARYVFDLSERRFEPRGPSGPPLTISLPRAELEGVVREGLAGWLTAWDRGIVTLSGDPVKTEAVEVYVERVLRRLLPDAEVR